jgi:hypothetical protein
MMKLLQGHVLALPHLPLGLLNQRALLRREDVVQINRSLRLDQHAARSPGEGYQVPLVQIKVVALSRAGVGTLPAITSG